MNAKIDVTINPEVVKAELLRKYPPKVARNRAKHIILNEETAEIAANARTIPGIISQRGCCYAGCKGVVLGPTRDMVHIVHGPIGCSFYAWLTRRNQTKPASDEDANFIPYCFSTDMQEEEIIFGGEKKLKRAIQEAYDLFKPKAITVFATCPVGLIGDDIHAVAREMKQTLGINIISFSCEGYKGVSQSAGHHIANNEIFKHIVGTDDTISAGQFRLNLLGEYNIGGDAFEIERIFSETGVTLVSTFSGNSTYDQFANAHTADLNLVMCHRSINYMADMMEKKYGIPWLKVNFIGADATAKALRRIAEYYEDAQLAERIENFITQEMAEVIRVREEIKRRTAGKLAMLFVGGSRAHHYQQLFKEIGMKTISAGYEFAHRDDYEGRQALPTITVDADSRNIEELKVTPDPEKYHPRRTEEALAQLKAQGLEVGDYFGMMNEMESGSLVIDDLTHYEAQRLIEIYKPAIFCAGIKEKYTIQKNGIPLKQLHNYDYGGPYAGFRGAINFYREIDRMVNSKIWTHIKAPWQKSPELKARYTCCNA